MPPRLASLITLLCLSCLQPVGAQRDLRVERDGKRVALVVGNNSYPKGSLKNAVNDARALGSALRDVGFRVEVVTDAGLREMEAAANRFVSNLAAGDVALFYYAGHGVQIDGENYLIPVDYRGQDEADIKYGSRSASWLQDKMERTGAQLKILILDACRNNPFRVSRSAGGGLAQMQGGRGSFVAFATAAGKVANDNPGSVNGLFTQHLLRALQRPGLSLDEVFNRVRVEVDRDSLGQQLPYVYSGVIGQFYFRPPAGGSAVSLPGAALPKIDQPRPGKTPAMARVHRVDGQRYVWIPPGAFRMGCSEGDGACRQEEMPPHEVTIGRGFWLGQTEVTDLAYEKFSRDTGSRMPKDFIYDPQRNRPINDLSGNPFKLPDYDQRNKRLPIVEVTWAEAVAFCKWAGGRLPTEAEWEYAARGGTAGARYGRLDTIAWYSSRGSPAARSEAGLKQANAFGLHDMIGNVWEWVADWYEPGYYRRSPAADPKGPEAGVAMVLRGGSVWSRQIQDLRSSTRVYAEPGKHAEDIGFRCVCEEIAP